MKNMNNKLYVKILILSLFILFYYYILVKNNNCNDITTLFTTNNTLINQIKEIDETFFQKTLNLTGELFTIDIKNQLLNLNSKNLELSILKRILLIEERKFELFLFTSFEDFKSSDSILNTIHITSEIKQVKIVHNNIVDFAEFGTCTLLDKNNKIINATFLLIKHTGSSEELWNICKNNVLFDLEIFRKNIIQLSIPRKLEIKMYSIQPIENFFKIFNKLQILIKRNYGVIFGIVYSGNLEGFIIESYDITSEIQWYLRFINLKHVQFIIKVNKEISEYLNLPDIKVDLNKYLKSFLESRNTKFTPILENNEEKKLWNNFKQDYKFEARKNKNFKFKRLK